jgi:hypothetical protein
MTPDQHAAEIRRILATKGADRADERRLYAEQKAHGDAIEAAYAEARGWKQSKPFGTGTLALGKMHDGNSRDPYRCGGIVMPSDRDILDHVSWWKRGRWPVAIVSQPYAHNLDARRAEFIAWGAARGLRVTFPTDFPSWWFPGCTVLIEITRAVDVDAEVARAEQEFAQADEAGGAPVS